MHLLRVLSHQIILRPDAQPLERLGGVLPHSRKRPELRDDLGLCPFHHFPSSMVLTGSKHRFHL